MCKTLRISILCLLVLTLVFVAPTPAAPAQKQITKRHLTHDDYDSWKSTGTSAISTDGKWILYLKVPQDGDADLIVKNVKTLKEFRHSIGYTGEETDSERAANPQFSYDATHVVFLISPSKAEVKEEKKAKKEEEEEKKK